MSTIGSTPAGDLTEREVRFLRRLSSKYGESESAGALRSYLLAALMFSILFAVARWVPWTLAGWLVVELLGLTMFHQYKRFAHFKSCLLTKLWLLHNRTG